MINQPNVSFYYKCLHHFHEQRKSQSPIESHMKVLQKTANCSSIILEPHCCFLPSTKSSNTIVTIGITRSLYPERRYTQRVGITLQITIATI